MRSLNSVSEKFSYKTLALIIIFLLIPIILLLRVNNKPKTALAEWWNDAWTYRKAITLTNSGVGQTEVYLSLSIDTTDNSRFQSDCGDIRFTNQGGDLLEYYLVSGCTTADTQIHINFPTLPAGASNIYLYYGNPSADNGFSTADFITAASFVTPAAHSEETGQANTTNTSIGPQSEQPLSSGLVGYWKFNEGVGTTSVDYSGNSGPSILSGSTSPSWSIGKFGNGLDFNGTSSYVKINNTTALQDFMEASFTISGWVYPDGYPTSASLNRYAIAGKTGCHTGSYYSNTGNFIAEVYNSACQPTTLNSGSTFPPNNWYLVTMTVSLETRDVILYVNGQKQGTTKYSGTLRDFGVGPFQLGKFYDNSNCSQNWSYCLKGKLDEIRAYNRALSQNEITQLFNYAPAPIRHYKFDDEPGSTVLDSSGNNAHATVFGTPQWTTGKFGRSLSFNGSTDYLTLPSTSTLQAFTASLWIKSTTATGGPFNLISGSNAGWYPALFSGFIKWYDGQSWRSSTSPVANGQWHHVGLIHNQGSYSILIDGKIEYTGTGTFTGGSIDTIADINYHTRKFPGQIDDVKIYDYARTPQQIIADMNGDSASTINQRSMLAWYRFDEGSGSIVNNSGSVGSTLNASLSGNPSWIVGKNNKAISLNGSGQYASTPDSSTFSFGTGDFSLSSWVKTNNNGVMVAIGRYGGSGNDYWLGSNNGKPTFSISGTGVTGPSISDNNWHHLVGSRQNGTLYLYIDGVLKGQNANSLGASPSGYLGIGKFGSGSTFYWNGSLDDVKIYNYALSADEIKTDYNQNSSFVFGTSNQTIGGTTTSLEYCLPGDTSYCAPPVGEYKFDEGVGSTAFDTGTSRQNLSFGASTAKPSHQSGYIGKSVYFDGTDYIGINDSTTLSLTGNMTAGVWVKTSSTQGGGIMTRYNNHGYYTWRLYMNTNGTVTFNRGSTGVFSTDLTSTVSINDNRWHYITIHYNGSQMKLYIDGIQNNQVNENRSSGGGMWYFCIGNHHYDCALTSTNSHFIGQIDHIRVYDYARTPAQITWDYNQGGPLIWQKLDECQDSIAHDSSGKNNHSSIVIGPNGTQNSLGTCQVGTSAAWTNGAGGQVNSSLSLDGTDDYLSIPGYQPAVYSFSLWIKPQAVTSRAIANTSNSLQNSAHDRDFYFDSNSKIVARIWDGNAKVARSATTAVIGNWYHLVQTYDGTNLRLYINGVNEATTPSGSPYTGYTTPRLIIGNCSTTMTVDNLSFPYYSGQVDDVRYYSYPLTSTQIQQLYNGGSINFR